MSLWSYAGPEGGARAWAEASGIERPVLVDDDSSLRKDYFIPNGDGAFASNPRHYVIGADGRFAFIQTSVAPEALEEAIRAALEAASAGVTE